MMRETLSKLVLVWGILLWALCANALQTSSDFAEKASTSSLLDEDPHAFNMTLYERDCKHVLEANSLKLNPICSEGSLGCIYHWLYEAKDKGGKQEGPESPLFACRHKQKKDSVKGDAVYILKARRTPRIGTTIRVSGKKGPKLRQAWHHEDFICLRVKGNLKCRNLAYRQT
ncbi:unnamed protein product [Calypogeia fissa]